MGKTNLRGISRLSPRRMLWCTTAIMLAMQPLEAAAAVREPDAAAHSPASQPAGVHAVMAQTAAEQAAGMPDSTAAEPEETGQSTAETPPDWVMAHGPYTHWYPDTTQLVRNRNEAGDQKAWKDVIGTREFDTKGIAVRWEGKVLHLAIFTNFPDRNVMAAGRTVAPADLALDMDGNGTLETGVVLSGVPSAGDKGVVRAANIRRGQAYKVTKWLRPDDILAHTYGQGWRWMGLTGQELAYAAVPVWVGEGTPRDDLDVTVDWRVNGRGSDYVVFVTLTKTSDNGELWNLPVIWGTAVCGNDVVFAPIARLGDLLTTTAEREEETAKDGEETDGDGTDESAGGELAADGGLGVGVDPGGSGEAKEGEETISEGVSEGSDETAPTWNDPLPVAFPESTGESTSSGGTSGGGGGGGGGTSSGSGTGGGGSTSEGGSGGTSGGSGGTTSGGGTDPENPLAPEGGGGEETTGEGGTENAVTEIPEPSVAWLLGTAAAGLAVRTIRRRRGGAKARGG